MAPIAVMQADDIIQGNVPGTVHLVDLDGTMGVKHDGKTKDVVLYPAPSSDPGDPLNRSWRKNIKNSIILQMYVSYSGFSSSYSPCTRYTGIVGGSTASGYAVYPNIIANTGIPLTTLNSAVGVMFLFLGWGTLIWCPIGLQWGRRGVYIITTLGCMVSRT